MFHRWSHRHGGRLVRAEQEQFHEAHFAIEAAKRADVSLVLAGTIDRYQQESMRYFQEELKPLFDAEQIKYVGPVNFKQKQSLLSRARGFLNPIEWEEPFGMVMIEAMAVGCPVISFARGAAPEIVAHGETGFLVQNVDEMAQSIARIDEIDRETTRLHAQRNFSMILQKLQQRIARNKVRLARLHHLRSYFVRTAGNNGVQSQHISRVRKLGNDGLAFARRCGKFCLTGAEHENSTRLLPFNEEHRSLGIDSSGFDFIKALSGVDRQIAEKVFFPHRTSKTIIKNI